MFFFPECQVWDAILDGLREFREWQAAQPDLNEDDAEEDDDDYGEDGVFLHFGGGGGGGGRGCFGS